MIRKYVWLLIVVMIVVHQGLWFGADERLVAGFLPWGLFYHVIVSLLVAFGWWEITRHAWPTDLMDESETGSDA